MMSARFVGLFARRSMAAGRIALALAVLLANLALPGPVAASSTLVLTPNSGPIGTSVTASGSGFTAGQTIRIRFDGQLGPTVATTTANSSGAYSVTFAVPAQGYSGDPVTTKDYFV